MSGLFDAPGMFFPAIPLWQPYASLPLVDAKPWETRGRPYPAKYHGRRIVVCATKAFAPRSFITPALDDLCTATLGEGYQDSLPRGQALYTIVLKGCERTEDMVHKVPPELLASGDFSAGRWAWEWGDVEPFNPFPVSCSQGWFRVTVPDGAFRCATVLSAATASPAIGSSHRLDEPLLSKGGGESSSRTNSGGTASPKTDSQEGH